MRYDAKTTLPATHLCDAILGAAVKLAPTAVIAIAAVTMMFSAMMVSAQVSWLSAQNVQSQLAAGKVVSQTRLDPQNEEAQIDAAIRIDAAAQNVWDLLTDCKSAAIYIPGLKRCRVLDSAADGSWAIIEHDIKYSALLPAIHSVYRADYAPLERIDFHGISGDLKDESGAWMLRQSADHTVILEYKVALRPGFWVPRSVIQRSLKKQLPAALVALRAQAQSMATPDATAANASVPSTAPVSLSDQPAVN